MTDLDYKILAANKLMEAFSLFPGIHKYAEYAQVIAASQRVDYAMLCDAVTPDVYAVWIQAVKELYEVFYGL